MFWFTKKKIIDSEVLKGLTDCHSHILPGVDDGVQQTDEALEALAYYESLGVKRIVFTPHIINEYPQNNASSLRKHFETFKEQYTGNIKLRLAAEYMLDHKFEEHLEENDMLCLGDNFILLETEFVNKPAFLKEKLRGIQNKGYNIALAHPERYRYMGMTSYKKLKEANIYFQLNLLSLFGFYGNSAEEKAKELLLKGYYNFVGTDLHNKAYHEKAFNKAKLSKKELRILESLIEHQNDLL